MDVIVSKFALLEAAFLLLRAVTIVRDTSATNSSRSLMIQSMCIMGVDHGGMRGIHPPYDRSGGDGLNKLPHFGRRGEEMSK